LHNFFIPPPPQIPQIPLFLCALGGEIAFAELLMAELLNCWIKGDD
jgi:hypothetical protein